MIKDQSTNTLLFLLIWCWSAGENPLGVVVNRCRSELGQSTYDGLIMEFLKEQSTEQLVLISSALAVCWNSMSDSSELNTCDCPEKPVTASFLADINGLLHDRKLQNKALLGERMMCSLVRTLVCQQRPVDKLPLLIPKKASHLKREYVDNSLDQYWRERLRG